MFDFDGVIANSEPLHFLALRDVLAAEGLDLSRSDYYSRYLGFDDVGAFNAIASDRGRQWTATQVDDLLRQKARRLKKLERDVSVLFPGAEAAIRRLSAVCPLAIASGALREEITRVLDREHLSEHFSAIVAAEDTSASKPAPDPYLRVLEKLSTVTGARLSGSDCVAIEDSQWGLISARSAGLRTVAITHTYPSTALTDADLVVDRLEALTWELLSKFDAQAP